MQEKYLSKKSNINKGKMMYESLVLGLRYIHHRQFSHETKRVWTRRGDEERNDLYFLRVYGLDKIVYWPETLTVSNRG